MSLETWKKEFYRIPADDMIDESWEAALDHSLLKWIGLRKENLVKHDVWFNKNKVLSINSDDFIYVSAYTCALCLKTSTPLGGIDCSKCPLPKIVTNDCNTEYEIQTDDNNPEPMIELLAKALDQEISK